MPVYNAGDYLVEAIKSIMHQTYQHFEFIIIDDASTDTSWKIIQRYKKWYPKKIRAYRLKRNLGKGGEIATNLGISKARGSYIAKMDSDDIAHPKRLEKQVQYLQKNKHIFLAGSFAYIIDKNGDIIGKKEGPTTHQELYDNFFVYNYIIHPSIMFRNPHMDTEKDFYVNKFDHFNEYYMFFKLMTQGKQFANIPEPLLYYRIHGGNETFHNIKKKFMSTLAIKSEFVFKLGYQPTLLQLGTTFIQALLVFFVPEKLTILLYLLSRHVISPKQFVESARSSLFSSFSFTKELATSLVRMFI